MVLLGGGKRGAARGARARPARRRAGRPRGAHARPRPARGVPAAAELEARRGRRRAPPASGRDTTCASCPRSPSTPPRPRTSTTPSRLARGRRRACGSGSTSPTSSAYVRPGGALEREAERRATSVYVPGAVEPMLPEALSNRACSLVPGEDRLAVTVEMAMHGAEVALGALPTARSSARDARLTYEQVDRVLRGARGGRRAVGRAARRRPGGGPRAARAARARRRAGGRVRRADLLLRPHGPRGGGRPRAAQTESHWADRAAHGPGQRAGGRRTSPSAGRRRSTACTSGRTRARSSALLERLASLDVPTPPVPEHMSPQQAGELVGEISRWWPRTCGAPAAAGARSLAGAALAEAGATTRRATSATPGLAQRALLPLHLAHPPLPRPRGPPGPARRRSVSTTPRRGRTTSTRPAPRLPGRARGDAGSSATPTTSAAASSSSAPRRERGPGAPCEGEVVGLDRGSGAFVSFGAERFEGFLPRAPACAATGGSSTRRARRSWASARARTVRIGDPVSVEVTGIEVPRGRVDLVPAGEG